MKWNKTKENPPKHDQWIACYRIRWPSFYWMGQYDAKNIKDPEDLFDYWIAIPEVETDYGGLFMPEFPKDKTREWISTKIRPPSGEPVLIVDMTDKTPQITIGACFSDRSGDSDWTCYSGSNLNPTHWMPLPEPPEVKE